MISSTEDGKKRLAGVLGLRWLKVARTAPKIDRLLELPYHIVLVRDEGDEGKETWTARVEELPGCNAHAETPDGATRAISKAMEEWLAAAIEKGAAVPQPKRTPSHSGRLLLRLPQGLHAELANKADREEVSLNGLITGMLAGAVGWQLEGETRERGDGFLPAAIIANIVVLVLAAIAAVTLLVIALQSGW